MGVQEYRHSVEQVDEYSDPSGAIVFEYSEQSPNAQEAFDEARQSPDGSAIVYGESNKPPEWSYGDAEGWYFVRYQGEYYELTTHGGGLHSWNILLIILWRYLAVLAIVVGAVSFRSEQPKLAPAVLASMVVLFGGTQLRLLSPPTASLPLLGIVLLLAIAAAVGTWVVLGRRVYATE